MAAEQYVVAHHLATVISQSFASAEGAFGSAQSLENLRYAFKSAAQNGVTLLGSSGGDGSAGSAKTPVGQGGSTLPSPAVEWPASDPPVTGVGGTDLCTDPGATSGRVPDSASPAVACQNNVKQPLAAARPERCAGQGGLGSRACGQTPDQPADHPTRSTNVTVPW
ncbi:hypothetical protein ACU639_36325 [Streptomyces cynarae]|uniref:hypothetical protein n=1 Tax=Streptomyces cynarae TaxID=2981134 RepID=UPI00406D08B5